MKYFESVESTQLWLQKKWGKFGASNIYSLYLDGKNGDKFSEGGKNLILSIAREQLSDFNTDEKVETEDMRMGKDAEVLCNNEYSKFIKTFLNLDVEYFGVDNPMFELYTNMTGCSPDALVRGKNKKVLFGVEYKNFKASKHFLYSLLIKESFDVFEKEPKAYAQCQLAMMVFNTDLWHLVFYNDYAKHYDKCHIVEIKKDVKFQEKLKLKIKKAEQIVNTIVESKKNNTDIDLNTIFI